MAYSSLAGWPTRRSPRARPTVGRTDGRTEHREIRSARCRCLLLGLREVQHAREEKPARLIGCMLARSLATLTCCTNATQTQANALGPGPRRCRQAAATASATAAAAAYGNAGMYHGEKVKRGQRSRDDPRVGRPPVGHPASQSSDRLATSFRIESRKRTKRHPRLT